MVTIFIFGGVTLQISSKDIQDIRAHDEEIRFSLFTNDVIGFLKVNL